MCTNTSNRISLLAAGVLAVLLLSACRHNQETPAAFAIQPQSDVVAPGSTFTVTASHLPQDCAITWLVDGGTVEAKEPHFLPPPVPMRNGTLSRPSAIGTAK